jgi:hypothetical protein
MKVIVTQKHLTISNYRITVTDMVKPKAKKVGRPKLPKGEAKGRIVPVRFTGYALKAIEAQARARKQTVSEWIRATIDAAIQ